MRLLKKLNNKEGSSLVVVIVCFAVLMVLGTSLITISTFSHNNSAYYHRQQQAQYTAESVIKTLTAGFADPNKSEDVITEALAATAASPFKGSGDLSANNMGTYTVELSYDASASPRPLIRAEVISNYQGSSYKLSAYYKEGRGDRLNPLDFIIMNRKNQVDVSGTLMNRTTVDGKFFSRGILYSKNVNFNDKVLLQGSGVVSGNSLFKESLILQGTCDLFGMTASEIQKDGFYDGGVTGPSAVMAKFQSATPIGIGAVVETAFRQWSSIDLEYDSVLKIFKMNGLVFEWLGGVTVEPPGTIESGGVYYMPNGDTFDSNYGTRIYTAANGDILNISTANPVFISSDPSSFMPKSLAGNIAPTGPMISDGQYQLNDLAGPVNATLDTTVGDIHLYCDGNLNVDGIIDIKGDNNVYIHIPDGKTLTVKQNRYLGKNTKAEHQLFVVADDANVVLENNATFKGAIYLREGTFQDNGLRVGVPKVYGSISATTINIVPGNTYKYVDYFKEPECNATMVDPSGTTDLFLYPKITALQKDWLLTKYDK